jgi:hypothetical protein
LYLRIRPNFVCYGVTIFNLVRRLPRRANGAQLAVTLFICSLEDRQPYLLPTEEAQR